MHRISESRGLKSLFLFLAKHKTKLHWKDRQTIVSPYASWLLTKKLGKNGKALLHTHARICFTLTRKVFHQARPAFIYLGMHLRCFKSQETEDIFPITFIFPLYCKRLKVLKPPNTFKIRRTRVSQFPGKEATLVAKAEWHLWLSCLTPSDHLTKVLEYFSFLNCSRILQFLPIFWISQKREGFPIYIYILLLQRKKSNF